MNNINLSIILPTINEADNLSILIPEIKAILNELNLDKYEILIVDDGSEDNTLEIIKSFNKADNRVNILERNNKPSLPMSIWDGVVNSKNEYVMWLDADGSMTALAIKKILTVLNENKESVIIGSRFSEGGGYKGVKVIGNTNFLEAIKNVRKSKDSVAGMIASIVFNKFLNYIFPFEVKDLTSGFIVGKKKYFHQDSFSKSSYGEYFLFLISKLAKNNVKIIEVGYVCETRISGESKTASSLIQLIQRGIPYIKAAIISRKEKHENF